MAVGDVLAQLQQLLRRAAPLVEGAEPLPERLPRLNPGQQVQATVLSQLPSGRFLVQVNGQALDVNLPPDTRPGARLELRFVGYQPRPTFLLAGEIPAAGRTTVNLSDTARYIGALLERASRLAEPAGALTRATPVLPAPPADARQLAVALKTALAESGLFYESHQAQWVAGQRSLPELLREPQARLSEPRAQGAARAEGEGSAAFGAVLDSTAEGVSRGAEAPGAARGGPGLAGPPEAREPMHPATLPLVQQQLQTLDTGQIVWQGMLWPGQTLRWTIVEGEGGGARAGRREWQTRLSLTLPLLGEVEARLDLGPAGIGIAIAAASAESRERLASRLDELRAGFEQAGLTLAHVVVKEDGRA